MIILVFAGLAMRPANEKSPLALVTGQYHADLQTMLGLLTNLADSLEQGVTTSAMQGTFKEARLAYKRASFLADYLDPEFVKDYINGAPLPKLERNYSQVEVLEPKGFQPLEELLWEEQTPENQLKATAIARDLQQHVRDFVQFQKSFLLEDRMVLEALRFGYIRLFTLDLAGFDSPASGESLAEVRAAYTTMSATGLWYAALHKQDNPALYKRLKVSWDAGSSQLATAVDFDAFDRLYFLKSCINPLFADLLVLHEDLGYPKSNDLNTQKVAVNYNEINLFAPDFLNPFYYTQMVSSEYDSSLIALGKLLFYDPVLSATNDRACASCHQPEKGFTDGFAKSMATGMQGHVKRNAPTLLNAVYSPRFFWDMRTNLLETQFEHVLVSSQEFNSSVMEVLQKLKQSDGYTAYFKSRFPQFASDPINPYTLNMALSAFVVSLRSFNSPFDQYVRGEINTIPEEVKHGFNLFMGKAVCGTCHFAPSFGGIVPPWYQEQESEILGVPDTAQPPYKLDADVGRAGGIPKENSEIYRHSFKTVSVRNVALTAPYMHNGVYSSLEEVIDFYHKGGGVGLGLEVPYQTLPFDSLSLDDTEKHALKAFMLSLTDTAGLSTRPVRLPAFPTQVLNQRVIGGVY